MTLLWARPLAVVSSRFKQCSAILFGRKHVLVWGSGVLSFSRNFRKSFSSKSRMILSERALQGYFYLHYCRTFENGYGLN